MKIVVLDGYTMNPGDLDWQPLENLGELHIHDRTPPGKVVERCAGAAAVLTNKVPLNDEHFSQLPHLKYIGVTATGYNIVELEKAASRGITVTNVSGYSTRSVTQHVFALILALFNRVHYYSEAVRQGRWHQSADFSFWDGPIEELAGKTLGIIGFGTIGRNVGNVARSFGMNIISYHTHPDRDREDWVTFKPVEEVFSEADIISLHCPLTEENAKFVDRNLLNMMKPTACLINTARGPLVDHDDLEEAIRLGSIAGAGLDVFDTEPPDEEHPLFRLSNVMITPHQAWASRSARKLLLSEVAANLQAWQEGERRNVVK